LSGQSLWTGDSANSDGLVEGVAASPVMTGVARPAGGRRFYFLLFSDESERQAFVANPFPYVPALGGDCVVAYSQNGQRVPGSVQHASKHEGRLYLFSSADARTMFEANPASLADADLAYGGNCVVCAVGMGQAMPGRPEFTTIHKGLRYRFPSADQQREFVANPAKYEAMGATRPQAAAPGGSTARPAPPAGSGSGSR
jgi:YHS domain-containing protein